jgi:hypothetical protein
MGDTKNSDIVNLRGMNDPLVCKCGVNMQKLLVRWDSSFYGSESAQLRWCPSCGMAVIEHLGSYGVVLNEKWFKPKSY